MRLKAADLRAPDGAHTATKMGRAKTVPFQTTAPDVPMRPEMLARRGSMKTTGWQPRWRLMALTHSWTSAGNASSGHGSCAMRVGVISSMSSTVMLGARRFAMVLTICVSCGRGRVGRGLQVRRRRECWTRDIASGCAPQTRGLGLWCWRAALCGGGQRRTRARTVAGGTGRFAAVAWGRTGLLRL